MRRCARAAIVCLVVAVAALSSVAAAPAAVPLPLRITEIDASDRPIVRVGIVGGEHPETGEVRNLILREDGEPNTTSNVYAGPVGRRQQFENTYVMLAIDASLSMRGQRIQDAMRAADVVLDHLHAGDRVGVMTFGGGTEVLVQPTSDLARVRRVLASPPELTLGTALYDAVKRGSGVLPDGDAHRVLIVLTDGVDVDGTANLEEAATAAREAAVEVVAVGIGNEEGGVRALGQLAEEAGGSYHSVAQAGELTRLYDDLSVALLRTHWLEFNSMRGDSDDVVVSLAAAGQTPVSDVVPLPISVSTVGPLVPRSARPEPVVPQRAAIAFPDRPWASYLAALPIGLAMALGFAAAVLRLRQRRLHELVTRNDRPETAMTAPVVPGRRRRLFARRENVEDYAAMSRRGPIARLLAETRRGRHTERMLELARVRLTLDQLATACLVTGACGATLALLVTGTLLIAVACGLVACLLVPGVISLIARRRRTAFDQQLPDALAAISSALRVGHGFDQAITAMTADAPEPIASEFRRAIEEARLGRPIEEGLQGIAERYDSREFDFVVTTVAIQRQVGGSLAEILEIVTTTLRDRLTFRQKVKALTSMGRMSVWVLLGLPFFIAAAVSLLQPGFLTPLFATTVGRVMLGGAAVSISIGAMLCRRIVSIRV